MAHLSMRGDFIIVVEHRPLGLDTMPQLDAVGFGGDQMAHHPDRFTICRGAMVFAKDQGQVVVMSRPFMGLQPIIYLGEYRFHPVCPKFLLGDTWH